MVFSIFFHRFSTIICDLKYIFLFIFHNSAYLNKVINSDHHLSDKKDKKSDRNNTSFDVFLLPFSLLNGTVCFYIFQTHFQLVNKHYTVKFTIFQVYFNIFYGNFNKYFFTISQCHYSFFHIYIIIPSLTVEKIKNCCKSNVYRLYGSLDTIFKI